ncbi:hypothetical protein D7Y41_17090 [Anaerotruncus sp. 1XD22-93]|nr:hypothetical protein [Anaerotruncus sp. 1XD42-93]RKJ88825.1 hypothetical protein D7Y41_17090 [Anaerotruncus sp. 1XD22-93]
MKRERPAVFRRKNNCKRESFRAPRGSGATDAAFVKKGGRFDFSNSLWKLFQETPVRVSAFRRLPGSEDGIGVWNPKHPEKEGPG